MGSKQPRDQFVAPCQDHVVKMWWKISSFHYYMCRNDFENSHNSHISLCMACFLWQRGGLLTFVKNLFLEQNIHLSAVQMIRPENGICHCRAQYNFLCRHWMKKEPERYQWSIGLHLVCCRVPPLPPIYL